jgi:hypothetical protein
LARVIYFVTELGAALPTLPLGSQALLVMTWAPAETFRVFQLYLHGDVLHVAFCTPSMEIVNWLIPELSVAVAAMFTVPETLLPFGGFVMITTGGVELVTTTLFTVTDIALLPTLSAVS